MSRFIGEWGNLRSFFRPPIWAWGFNGIEVLCVGGGPIISLRAVRTLSQWTRLDSLSSRESSNNESSQSGIVLIRHSMVSSM